MKQDALVAQGALNVDAVLLLALLEVGYDGVDLALPVGGECIGRTSRRLGSRTIHPLRQFASERRAQLSQQFLSLAVNVFNRSRQDHLTIGAVSNSEVPAVKRAMPRYDIFTSDV